MTVWNPDTYLEFADERSRPFVDLLSRINAPDPKVVIDLGCGPGYVTARLNALGVETFGVDLSEAMVTLARQSYPEHRFDHGSMTALNLPDGALGGIGPDVMTAALRKILPGVVVES